MPSPHAPHSGLYPPLPPRMYSLSQDVHPGGRPLPKIPEESYNRLMKTQVCTSYSSLKVSNPSPFLWHIVVLLSCNYWSIYRSFLTATIHFVVRCHLMKQNRPTKFSRKLNVLSSADLLKSKVRWRSWCFSLAKKLACSNLVIYSGIGLLKKQTN